MGNLSVLYEAGMRIKPASNWSISEKLKHHIKFLCSGTQPDLCPSAPPNRVLNGDDAMMIPTPRAQSTSLELGAGGILAALDFGELADQLPGANVEVVAHGAP